MSTIAFVLSINITLKNRNQLVFEASGSENDPCMNYINGWPSVSVSPQELATAETVDEMILLLEHAVEDDSDYVFAPSDGRECDASEFIQLIRNHIETMNAVESVTIEMKHFDEICFFRSYTYSRASGNYVGVELGSTDELGDEYDDEFDDFGPGTLCFVKESENCTILRKTRFYHEASFDDIYAARGCVLEKPKISTGSIFPVVVAIEGTAYEGRNDRIEHVKVGDMLFLKADYNNRFYAPVAIEVFNEAEESLGYLKEDSVGTYSLAEIAENLSGLNARVSSVTPLSKRTKRAKYALMDVELYLK